MQQTLYIRLAQGKKGYTADASTKPSKTPLYRQTGYRGGKEALPTIYFAINVNVSDNAFDEAARVVGDVNLGEGDYSVASAEIASLPTDD